MNRILTIKNYLESFKQKVVSTIKTLGYKRLASSGENHREV